MTLTIEGTTPTTAPTRLGLDVLRTRAHIDVANSTRALDALSSGTAAWVVVSGKMCAGKDTVAPELVRSMPTEPVMLRYGNLMRAELDPALDVLRVRVASGNNPSVTAHEIAELMNLHLDYARTLVRVLSPELEASGGKLTASGRTEGIRYVLQHLGDEWRCAEDEDYWARKAAQASLAEIGAGRSVILTGGRFLPDVDLPAAANAFLLRLDVTRQTQIDRLRERDGIDPTPATLEALDHEGETALDDYEGFNAHVDNNGRIEDCIAASLQAVTDHLTGLRTVAA